MCQERHFAPQKISELFRRLQRSPYGTSSPGTGAVQHIISRHRILQRKLSEIGANEAREKAAKPSASAA
jgi:hypothetical protein